MTNERVAIPMTIDDHWRALVTAAMLGTDRTDPPHAASPVDDLVADTVRETPSERMLAQVAATVAVRRAGVLPGVARPPLAAPRPDDRPPCVPAAVERWHHVVTSWPVLEDEWTLTLVTNGWRAAPELVPAMLVRHRGDPVRRARAEAAAGPLAAWLVDQLPDLAARGQRGAARVRGWDESVGELPELPIPADLTPLLHLPGAESGRRLADGITAGDYGAAHRAVLINVVARGPGEELGDLADVLGSIDDTVPGHGLAVALADLARTRHRMLDELSPPIDPAVTGAG